MAKLTGEMLSKRMNTAKNNSFTRPFENQRVTNFAKLFLGAESGVFRDLVPQALVERLRCRRQRPPRSCRRLSSSIKDGRASVVGADMDLARGFAADMGEPAASTAGAKIVSFLEAREFERDAGQGVDSGGSIR